MAVTRLAPSSQICVTPARIVAPLAMDAASICVMALAVARGTIAPRSACLTV